jgi:hypothetical protein
VSVHQLSLVGVARDLLERADPMTAGIWPRASALLARQALEAALDDLWRLRAPGLERCSTRAQLLCLPFYLPGGEELAERVCYAWAGLSAACHQHPYELPPTSPELLGWLATVEQLVARVRSLNSPERNASDFGGIR